MTPWTVARQAPLSMGFSRQEHWGGLPCPPPGDLPNPGIQSASPAFEAESLPLSDQGNHRRGVITVYSQCLQSHKSLILAKEESSCGVVLTQVFQNDLTNGATYVNRLTVMTLRFPAHSNTARAVP